MNDGTHARDERIRELRALGLAHRAIATEVGCSRSTVTNILSPEVARRAREASRRWEHENAEHVRERQREYHRKNADVIRAKRRANAGQKAEYDRQYRHDNAERIVASGRAWREANAGRKRQGDRTYREANAGRIKQRKRERWAANSERANATRRERYRITGGRERARRYRRANAEASRATVARRKARGNRAMDATDRFLSAEYRKAIANDPCTYCGAPGEHDDHLLPLARGGTDHWWNLHRTCPPCNHRKYTRTHEEFLALLALPKRISRRHRVQHSPDCRSPRQASRQARK